MRPFAALAATLLLTPGIALAQESSKAYETAMHHMMSRMETKPSGDADRDFVAMMLPHHQGAVDMAKVELQFGSDPTLRRMARAIVAAQQKEIAEMEAWRKAHP